MTDVLVPSHDAEERPPMVAALSPSSISTWKKCPKRFYFEKILRLETEPGLEAVCGSFVHQVLEHLMGLPSADRTAEQARRVATACWAEFVESEDSRFRELELDAAEILEFKRRAWAGISGYFAIEDPAMVDVVATEQQMQAELDGAPLFGIVDRLERWGDRLVVSDYKTGKAPKWQDEIDEKLEQLRLYAAILDAQGTPVSTLRLLFVSPQLGAAAKELRCAEAVDAAFQALGEVAPGRTPEQLGAAVDQVEAAHRIAREEAGPCDDRAEIARTAALAAALAAATALEPQLNADDSAALAQGILDAVAARRRAFFARRDALNSRPREITLEVLPEHIEAARAEVAAVWGEATACYDAWDFPAHTGVLCDWCPFNSMCEQFNAWNDAGRPLPSPATAG